MPTLHDPSWLRWSRRLAAIARTGLAYTTDQHDVERYKQILGVASEMAAAQLERTPDELLALFEHDDGYVTPKIDVRAAVFRADEVLLVRQRADGLWALPGGWADVGESPSEAVAREALEEAGFAVEPVRLLAVWDRTKHAHPPIAWHAYKLVFDCELLDEQRRATDGVETSEAEFFGVGALPQLSLARILPEQISRLYELHRNPGAGTSFD
jgi:ADP-ribose pyrophosphatase YjhB (NUDIX family)